MSYTYLRVLRKYKKSTRVELTDGTSMLIPNSSLHEWSKVEVVDSNAIYPRTLVGIDPSFSRTGIAILTTDSRLVFHTLSEPIGKKDFVHTYNSAYKLATSLKKYLAQYEPFDVVMEYAPPVSSMSPALFCLDSLYHYVLHDHIKHLYHPMTLATIIGKKNRTKADSVMKGLSIIADLSEKGFVMSQKRRPCHDCFEALIYVDYYLRNNNKVGGEKNDRGN